MVSGTEQREHGDGVAWQWETAEIPNAFYPPTVAMLMRHVPPESRILEIGVGVGHVLSEVCRRARCWGVGVDVLPSAMEASRRTAKAARVAVDLALGSGFALPFGDGSFDVVFSLGVIEHFEEARSLAMLREHARVCRAGGRVIVSTPNRLDVVHSARVALLGKRYRYYPERSYTPRGLRKLLVRAGMRPLARDGHALLWSLRQTRLAYPLTAVLFKLGLLDRASEVSHRLFLSLFGSLTVQVAAVPPRAESERAAGKSGHPGASRASQSANPAATLREARKGPQPS